MARPLARVRDVSSHGGIVVTGARRTFVNGRPVARMGDLHVCPLPFHGVTRICTGDRSTFVEGRPAARVGDRAACGAAIATGSPDTLA